MKGEDVTIVAAGDDNDEPCKFSAHIFISQVYLRGHLCLQECSNMKRRAKTKYNYIDDIERDVLKEMLKFVYTGAVPPHLQEMAVTNKEP